MIKKRALANSRMTVIKPPVLVNKNLVSVLTSSFIDGATWYTIVCKKPASAWLRETYTEQEDKMWYQHIDSKWTMHFNTFDVHESIYTALALKFS